MSVIVLRDLVALTARKVRLIIIVNIIVNRLASENYNYQGYTIISDLSVSGRLIMIYFTTLSIQKVK